MLQGVHAAAQAAQAGLPQKAAQGAAQRAAVIAQGHQQSSNGLAVQLRKVLGRVPAAVLPQQQAAELQGRLEAALHLEVQLSAARAGLEHLWSCEEGQEEVRCNVKEQRLVFEHRGCSITLVAMYCGDSVIMP